MKPVALALLLAPAIAAADDTVDPDTGYVGEDIPSRLEIDDCRPNDPTLTHDQLLAQGGEHYERGEQLYLQGDYKGAVRELVASYCTISFYSILKDIGQAYERDLRLRARDRIPAPLPPPRSPTTPSARRRARPIRRTTSATSRRASAC